MQKFSKIKSVETSSTTINVLSRDLKPSIEIIDKIIDEEIQREYLLKLKELIDQKENRNQIEPSNLQEL